MQNGAERVVPPKYCVTGHWLRISGSLVMLAHCQEGRQVAVYNSQSSAHFFPSEGSYFKWVGVVQPARKVWSVATRGQFNRLAYGEVFA